MQPWSTGQLRAFLGWSKGTDDSDYPAWLLLAMTGMRRGEALALQWRDIDADRARLTVRRTAKLVKVKGEGERIVIGKPKGGKSRVVDLDPATLAVLRAQRAKLAEVSLALARDDALVLGTLDGQVRHPERFSRTWDYRMGQIARALGDAAPPRIRLHDLRHSHATALLRDGQPVKVVSERLGHASPVITLQVYAHVMPGMQREAASAFAAMVLGGT